MTARRRHQRRYDHRLRDLVRKTGDVTIATDLGVPRSTARGWLKRPPTRVVGIDVADDTVPELQEEIVRLRRRVHALNALLRVIVVVLRVTGTTLVRERLPEERASRCAPQLPACAPELRKR